MIFEGKGVAPCGRKRLAVTTVQKFSINNILNKFYGDYSVILDRPGACIIKLFTVVIAAIM
jgi:hypothetical protein